MCSPARRSGSSPSPGRHPLARLVAAAAYRRGARFVDPWYFDPEVKRIRLERAAEDTLGFVPSWYGRRLVDLGAGHGVRISITPQVPPGLLAGIDPSRAGRDASAGAGRELRRDQRQDDELDRRPLALAGVGPARSSRARRRRRRWRGSGSSSSTCCVSTSPTRPLPGTRGSPSCTMPASASTRAASTRSTSKGRAPISRSASCRLLASRGDARHADDRRHRPRAQPPDRGGLDRRPTRRGPTASSARRSRWTSRGR